MRAAPKRQAFSVLAAALACLVFLADGASGRERAKQDRQRDREAPTAPANLRVTSATTRSVSVAWDPSTDNVRVRGYYVYVDGDRKTVSSTEYTVWRLSCGEAVAVEVAALDRAGNRSARTGATVSAAPCPDTSPPGAPTGFRQAATSQSAVVLAWNPSPDDVGVVAYGVYRSGLPLTTTVEPSVTLSALACGSINEYAVDAVDAAGNRSSRSPVWVQTSPCEEPAPAPPGDTEPPATPELSLGERTQTSLTLSWRPVADNVGVVRYDLFRGSSASAAAQTKVGDTSELSYTFTGLDCATDYSLALQAVDAAGNASALAEAIWFPVRTRDCAAPTPPPGGSSPDTTPPTQPANLAVAAATATSVALTWSPSTDDVGVAGYGVYRNGAPLPAVGQPGATVSGLQCGTAYTFEVDAVDAAGNRSSRTAVTASTAACPDTRPPTAPANVTATSRTTTSIALSWSASSDDVGVAGYGLYQAGKLVGTTTGTTGIFPGLACGTAYTLAVDAYDAAGNRSQSAAVLVTTTQCPDTTPPSAPAGLAASNVLGTSLTLTWGASRDDVGVARYEVYRDGAKVGSANATSYAVSGLSCGTSYAWGVEALDAAGNRSPRAQLTASTAACPPPPPPPSEATAAVAVSTSGSDATCVRGDLSRPCATFNRAYSIAQCGDVVELRAGTYGSQTIREVAALSGCAQDVVVRPAAGASVTVNGSIALGDDNGLGSYDTNAPDRLTLRGFAYTGNIELWGDADHVTVDGVSGGSVVIQGATNVTVRNSEFGPCPSYPQTCARFFILDGSAQGEPRTTNVLVENNVIHDFPITRSGDHWECVFATGGANVTIRGNAIYNCETYDIVLGDNGASAGFSGWVIENNWFGRTCCFGSSDRNSAVNLYAVTDTVIRFNSFAPGQTVTNEGGGTVSGVRVVGNVLGASGCAAGATYDFNVFLSGTGCGPNRRTIASPYVNSSSQGAMDYHLLPGTGAEGFVTPTTGDYALAFDRDGNVRSAPRDAGADER